MISFKEYLKEYIVKTEGGYEVKSEKGKNLGRTTSLTDAKKRLRQIEYFKHIDK